MNDTIVVTGGSKGIGKAVIEKAALNGFNIITCARNEDDLKALKEDIEGKFECKLSYLPTDMSKKAEVLEFARFVKGVTDTVVILVNNAGLFIPGQVHAEEDGALEQMIDTNLYSAYYLTREILPLMLETGSGHIFNMCSTASIMPYVNGGSYCISKFALLGFSKVLREEMKDKGIRVTSILPGATFTASWEGSDLPEDRFMQPDDVADAIWTAYELSDRSVMEEVILRPMLGDI
ncbi:MAG: SDR family oxidoreductase [Cyclobacteriaceae bacterium]